MVVMARGRGGGRESRRRRGGGRTDGWPCGGGDGGGAVRARTVCSRNAIYGGENGGTAATSSGLAPRNGPNCFEFHYFSVIIFIIVIKIVVVVVFRNDYCLLPCIGTASQRLTSTTRTITSGAPDCYSPSIILQSYLHTLQYFLFC